jgi:PAS domain S-box-containing protein
VVIIDKNGNLLEISNRVEEMSGYKKEELLGKTDSELLPKHVADAIWEMEEVVYQTGRESETEDNLVDGRGVNHVVMVKKAQLMDRKGRKQMPSYYWRLLASPRPSPRRRSRGRRSRRYAGLPTGTLPQDDLGQELLDVVLLKDGINRLDISSLIATTYNGKRAGQYPLDLGRHQNSGVKPPYRW